MESNRGRVSRLTEKRPTPAELVRDGRRIDAAMRKAARQAWRLHKQAGIPVPLWKNGRTVYVQPDASDSRSKPGPASRRTRKTSR